MTKLDKLVIKCRGCPVKKSCPYYEAGSLCKFEEEKPDLKTAEGILEALRSKIQTDYSRFQRAERLAIAVGSHAINRNMTPLSNALSRDLQILAELSIRFGDINERVEKRNEHQGTIIKAEQVNILQVSREGIDECQRLQQELKQLEQQKELLKSP